MRSTREGAGAFVAEQEIRPDPDFDDVQPLDEHGAGRTSPDPTATAPWVKRTTATPCMPDAASASSFCSLVISSGGALSGRSDARRVRLEGHRRRRAAALAGAAPDAVDDLHVPAVQPVEVAQRQHRIVPARRRIIGKVGDRSRQQSISDPQSLSIAIQNPPSSDSTTRPS